MFKDIKKFPIWEKNYLFFFNNESIKKRHKKMPHGGDILFIISKIGILKQPIYLSVNSIENSS